MKEDQKMQRHDRQLRFRDGLVLCLATFFLLFVMAVSGQAAESADDYPSRPIEHAVAVVGGKVDMFGRVIGEVLQKQKILSQPFVITYKPGTGGAKVMGYAFEKRGNPYITWGAGSSNALAMPLMQKLPFAYTDFTYIANMSVDATVLVVKSDSPFKTIDDLIAAARKKPNSLIQSGGSYTGSDNLTGLSIQNVSGVKWKFMSCRGADAEALLNVLSGSAHFTLANPARVLDYVRTGKMRVLVNASPIRYSEFNDVPTLKEAGLGEPFVVYRGIGGPPDMPEYAVKKLEAAFKKVSESARFKKYIADTMQLPYWLSTKDYNKMLANMNERYKVALEKLNLLKK